MLQCRKESALDWHGYVLSFSVILCLSVGLWIPSVCTDSCLINAGPLHRDKPCCNSLLITSVFNPRQTLKHGNQQFMQRSEIIWLPKLRSTVTVHWNTGNRSSTCHTNVIVSKMRIWQSTSGNLGTEGKLLVDLKNIYIIIILCIFSTNSSSL